MVDEAAFDAEIVGTVGLVERHTKTVMKRGEVVRRRTLLVDIALQQITSRTYPSLETMAVLS